MKANRLVLFAASGAALLALTGCTPAASTAAKVGDTTIPTSDVNFLVRMQCLALNAAARSPQAGGQPQTLTSTRQIRADILNALVQAALNAQVAAKYHAGYDPQEYRSVMDQFEAAVQLAPKQDQARFRDLVGSFYKGQLEVYALAAQQLARQGVTAPNNDELANAVATLQGNYRDSVEISINPEFGADASGAAGTVDPSLSRPLSSFAKQAISGTPTTDFLLSLPTNQRCG